MAQESIILRYNTNSARDTPTKLPPLRASHLRFRPFKYGPISGKGIATTLSNRIYIKLPICLGSKRVNWGAKSGRILPRSVKTRGTCQEKGRPKTDIFNSVKRFMFAGTFLCVSCVSRAGNDRSCERAKNSHMSKNCETIFNAPANLNSAVWKSFGFYKKEGNIEKRFAICL